MSLKGMTKRIIKLEVKCAIYLYINLILVPNCIEIWIMKDWLTPRIWRLIGTGFDTIAPRNLGNKDQQPVPFNNIFTWNQSIYEWNLIFPILVPEVIRVTVVDVPRWLGGSKKQKWIIRSWITKQSVPLNLLIKVCTLKLIRRILLKIIDKAQNPHTPNQISRTREVYPFPSTCNYLNWIY